MAEAAERFPCPKCGAGLRYDPAAQGLRCPFCGESRSIEAGGPATEADLLAALSHARAAHRIATDAPTEARRVRCDSCAAEVLVPPTEKAGRCPYCGSPQVHDEAPDPGRIPPDSVIPFAVDRPQAEALFRKWVKSLWFRPNALKHRTAIGEMRGVLLPYWTFDARAKSSWTAMAGYHYTVTVGSGKDKRTETRTRWEPASGRRSDSYDDLLVLASKGLDEELIAEIEPFETGALVPFKSDYLAGWSAEAYAIDVAGAWKIGSTRIHDAQRSNCASDVPGDTHRDLDVRTELSDLRYRHSLLPVWVAAYQFRGKTWRFLVNGQTGEVQGHAPFSWLKIAGLVLGIAAVVTILVIVLNS